MVLCVYRCHIDDAFSLRLMDTGNTSAEIQCDAHEQRPKPVPSNKLRNLAAHCTNGNSTSEREKRSGKRKQMSNLVPFRPKKKVIKTPCVKEPVQLASNKDVSLPNTSNSRDADWSPVTPNASKSLSHASVSTQTLQSSFLSAKQISHDSMRMLQIDGNFSDVQMRKIAVFLRDKTQCNRIIEPRYEQWVVEHHKTLEHLFEISSIVEKIPLSRKPLVICTDTSALNTHVEQQFQLPLRSVHHGVDCGKGFIKFDEEYEFESKDTPIMSKVIITAIAPAVSESYSVFKDVFERLSLPVAEHYHSFHADLKAIAHATGIDQANCSFSCPFCEVQITIRTTLHIQLLAATLRTCASNRRHYKKFIRSTKKKAAFDARNCIHDPLKLFPQSTPIISWCRMPRVHLRLHYNWFIDRMEKYHSPLAEWYKHYNQIRSEFHGRAFEGPQLRRLTKADSIKYLQELLTETSAPKVVWLFFNAMKALVQLDTSCFSKHILESGYAEPLARFKEACLLLPIKKVPLKMHIIVAHLDRALRETGRGLGYDSEEGHERAHHDFDTVWQRYRVRDLTSDVYGRNLLRAVLTYNSSHMPDHVISSE